MVILCITITFKAHINVQANVNRNVSNSEDHMVLNVDLNHRETVSIQSLSYTPATPPPVVPMGFTPQLLNPNFPLFPSPFIKAYWHKLPMLMD